MGEHPPRLVHHHHPSPAIITGHAICSQAATQVMTTGRAEEEWYTALRSITASGAEVDLTA